MAKLLKSKFLIIEGKGSEFMSAGFGGGDVSDLGVIDSGVFAGFSVINVEPGGVLVCDFCNDSIGPDDTCYFVAVLNCIYCTKCFERWHESAKHYKEDDIYEQRHFLYVKAQLQRAGILVEENPKVLEYEADSQRG